MPGFSQAWLSGECFGTCVIGFTKRSSSLKCDEFLAIAEATQGGNVSMISRRQCLQGAAAGALFPQKASGQPVTLESIGARLPGGLPQGVSAIIVETLRRDPSSINTDWFGSLLIEGLLQWNRRGIPEVRDYSLAWLDHHWNSKMVSRYSGPASRVFPAGKIPITTYAGHYGLAFPCYEMATQFQEPRARQACLDVARTILHCSSRNRLGMVNHDDNAEFAIPDTCYFAVAPLMMASVLDREKGQVYQEQALCQLRIYIDTFLVRETGLVRTILLKPGLGKTYWTRASGWLLWAIIRVMRYLPLSAPGRDGILEDLKILAGGVARIQDASGGFHVLLDEPATPLETTGTVMIAVGLHEAIRQGWLPGTFSSVVSRAWQFARGNIKDDGQIRQAYTGWAVPAEERVMSMDEHKMEWIPGFILSAASILTPATA
jgi:hypothetical protein